MTQQLLGGQARSKDCTPIDRVSEPARPERPQHLVSAVACSKCKAVNPHPGRWCVECGARLPAPQAVRISDAEKQAQRQATGKLRRAYKTLTGVTWLYRTGALAYAVVAAIAIFALGHEDVPREAGLLVVGLSTLLSVLMLMGALQILFRPLAWTLTVAALATVVCVTHFVGPDPLGLLSLWTAGWAVAFWAALWPTRRIQRVIAEHTDLYIAHHASRRTKRALEGRTPEARHERLMGVMHKAFLRSWKVSAAAGALLCLASVLGSQLVLTQVRPMAFAATLEGFEAAWNGGELEDVAGFYPQQNRPGEYAQLLKLAEGHGWRAERPALADGRLRQDDGRKWVDYELEAGPVSTSWMLSGQHWFLTGIALPTPPLDVTLARFLEAWSTSDPRAIARFYPQDYVERMSESIEYSARRRSWSRFPPVLGTVAGDSSERTAAVTLTLPEGEVVTKWLFRRSGQWYLQGLEFPEVKSTRD